MERPYWWDREADEHLEGAVKYLKNMIAGQATVLAFPALAGGDDDPAISGAAIRADDVRFPHRPNMRRAPIIFQPGTLPQSN